MSQQDDHWAAEDEDVVRRLRDGKPRLSAFELDRIKTTVMARVRPSTPRRPAIRSRIVVASLTVGLMAAGTAGAIAGGKTGLWHGTGAAKSQYRPCKPKGKKSYVCVCPTGKGKKGYSNICQCPKGQSWDSKKGCYTPKPPPPPTCPKGQSWSSTKGCCKPTPKPTPPPKQPGPPSKGPKGGQGNGGKGNGNGGKGNGYGNGGQGNGGKGQGH